MLAIYYGFILIIAFAPSVLGTPIAPGAVTTIGIPIGVLIIVAAFVLTGIYVRRANSEFDALNRQIIEEAEMMSALPLTLAPAAGAAGARDPRRPASRVRRRRDRRRGPAQPTNSTAIVMFLLFVAGTLGITYWAASQDQDRRRTSTPPAAASPASRTASRSPATTCRPPRSSASRRWSTPPAIDGLIYSIGFLVGWPIILFLIAERLRNLGKYTFADVASYRLQQTPIRSLAACGSLVVVALYLIAQMVGAGKLIQLLFGLRLRRTRSSWSAS